MKKSDIIGLSATFLGMFSLLILLQQIYTTQDTRNFTYLALGLSMIGKILFIINGYITSNLSVMVFGVIYFSSFAYILYVKMKNGAKEEEKNKEE